MNARNGAAIESQPVEAGSDETRRARDSVVEAAVLAAELAAVLAASQPRLALTRAEAARALGMSVDSLERYVLPEVRVVRRGTLVLIPVSELQRWLEASAERTLA
jgi:hypothetical protein